MDIGGKDVNISKLLAKLFQHKKPSSLEKQNTNIFYVLNMVIHSQNNSLLYKLSENLLLEHSENAFFLGTGEIGAKMGLYLPQTFTVALLTKHWCRLASLSSSFLFSFFLNNKLNHIQSTESVCVQFVGSDFTYCNTPMTRVA